MGYIIRMKGARKIVYLVLLCFLSSCQIQSNLESRLEQESAIHAMIDIKEAEDKYRTANGRYGELKELVDAGLIKADLSKDVYRGYRYEIRAKRDSYEAFATPLNTTEASFFLDEAGRIRYNLNKGQAANRNDTPIVGS